MNTTHNQSNVTPQVRHLGGSSNRVTVVTAMYATVKIAEEKHPLLFGQAVPVFRIGRGQINTVELLATQAAMSGREGFVLSGDASMESPSMADLRASLQQAKTGVAEFPYYWDPHPKTKGYKGILRPGHKFAGILEASSDMSLSYLDVASVALPPGELSKLPPYGMNALGFFLQRGDKSGASKAWDPISQTEITGLVPLPAPMTLDSRITIAFRHKLSWLRKQPPALSLRQAQELTINRMQEVLEEMGAEDGDLIYFGYAGINFNWPSESRIRHTFKTVPRELFVNYLIGEDAQGYNQITGRTPEFLIRMDRRPTSVGKSRPAAHEDAWSTFAEHLPDADTLKKVVVKRPDASMVPTAEVPLTRPAIASVPPPVAVPVPAPLPKKEPESDRPDEWVYQVMDPSTGAPVWMTLDALGDFAQDSLRWAGVPAISSVKRHVDATVEWSMPDAIADSSFIDEARVSFGVVLWNLDGTATAPEVMAIEAAQAYAVAHENARFCMLMSTSVPGKTELPFGALYLHGASFGLCESDNALNT